MTKRKKPATTGQITLTDPMLIVTVEIFIGRNDKGHIVSQCTLGSEGHAELSEAVQRHAAMLEPMLDILTAAVVMASADRLTEPEPPAPIHFSRSRTAGRA